MKFKIKLYAGLFLISSSILAGNITKAEPLHRSELPEHVFDSKGRSVGVFTVVDAFSDQLSNVTLNGRNVATVELSGEIKSYMFGADEFSQDPADRYFLWKAYSGLSGASDFDNIVSGGVDISAITPLEYNRRLSVNVTGLKNYNSDSPYSKKALGATAGVAYLDHFLDDSLGIFFFSNIDHQPSALADSNRYHAKFYDQSLGKDRYALDGLFSSSKIERDRFIRNFLGVQWLPVHNFELNFDILYSVKLSDTDEEGYEISNITKDIFSVSNIQDDQIEIGSGNIDSNSMNLSSFASREDSSSSLLHTGLNAKYFISQLWKAEADFSVSIANLDSDSQSVSSANTQAGGNININKDGGFSIDRDLADIATNRPYKLVKDSYDVSDDLVGLRLNVTRNINAYIFESIVIGTDMGYHAKTVDYKSKDRLADQSARFSDENVYGKRKSDDDVEYLLIDFDKTVNDSFADNTPWYVQEKRSDALDLSFKNIAAYAKLNFSGHLGSSNYGFKGNLGVRSVNSILNSKGTTINYNDSSAPNKYAAFDVSKEKSYIDILPSFNISFFKVGDSSDVLNIGVSQRIAYPNLYMLRSGMKLYKANDGELLGIAGNPDLKPWKVAQADLRYAHYFDFGSLISAGVSYKYLERYVNTKVNDITVRNGSSSLDATYKVTNPVNDSGGSIISFDTTIGQRIPFFPERLGVSGVYFTGALNYTDVDEFTYNRADRKIEYPLLGFSRLSLKTAWWYYYPEMDLSLKLEYTYLSEKTALPDYTNYDFVTDNPMHSLNFLIQSNLTAKLRVVFEVQNLTNERYSYYRDRDKSKSANYSKFGNTFKFGLSYNFL